MSKLEEARRYLARHGRLNRVGKHYLYDYTRPDGKEVTIRVSHGNGEIPRRVWKQMLKDMGITQEEFNRG